MRPGLTYKKITGRLLAVIGFNFLCLSCAPQQSDQQQEQSKLQEQQQLPGPAAGMQPVILESGIGGNGNLSWVIVDQQYLEGAAEFGYLTGGSSAGKTPLNSFPDKQVFQVKEGHVEVKVYSYDENSKDDSEANVLRIARTVKAATSVWPGILTPIIVELYLVPPDVSYQFARPVTVSDGDPFFISLFLDSETALDDRTQETAETAAHELYHAFTGRWKLGVNNQESLLTRGMKDTAEEAMAELYAACGYLKASDEMHFRESKPRFEIVDVQIFEGVLNSDEIGSLLNVVTEYSDLVLRVGPLFAQTAFDEIFSGNEAVQLESAEGERLLSLCNEYTANPLGIIDWFRGLAAGNPGI